MKFYHVIYYNEVRRFLKIKKCVFLKKIDKFVIFSKNIGEVRDFFVKYIGEVRRFSEVW